MARIRMSTLWRAVAHAPEPHPVHFHSGPQGQPAVCYDQACSRPKLDVG